MKRRFKKTYIEITNICNMSCSFCPKTLREPNFMSKQRFEDILKKLEGHAEHLYFHVMGEPLLHPQLGEFIDLAGEYKYNINLTTNGVLIDKGKDQLAGKSALRQVNFSLHSFEANTVEFTRNQYIDNIFSFIRNFSRTILISLRLWNLSEHEPSNESLYILNRIEEEFKLPYKIIHESTPVRGIKLVENVFLNQAPKFDWPNPEASIIGNQGFCYGLRNQIAILVDGTVVPCCLDGEGRMPLGNIGEQELSNILEGERAKKLYENFTKHIVSEEMCMKCGYRERFGQ